MKNAMFDKEWFKLDNAAKIYPAARSSRWNAVFRMSAVMKEEVNPEILQQALDDVIDRFPTFRMTLKKGFFWYYFQFVEHKPKIQEETDFPCAMMRLTGRDYVFRVLYHSHRISVEVFHSITDGTGNITFLKTLVMRYCELCGAKIENVGDILHYDDDPTPEEVEDSFSRFIDKSKGTLPRKEPSAYQIKGQREKRGVLNVTQGRMPFEQLHSVAKSFGCTVNTYLTAVLAYALLKRQLYEKKAHKKPIRVQVPINLRKIFGSETLRNFAGYYNTNLSPE
ncbi:MAG: alcohol acetyltransferase, partial [Clostridia bacterium]|nr:alcohol acetyltransferase [Clostridia bacterium]